MTLNSNVVGLLNLLEATDPIDYQHFVCGGSSLEYGAQAQALKETDLPNPLSFFGATKAAATILCRQYARANQRPISILRFFSVYGPWEPAKRLIPTAIAAAFFDREVPLTEPGYRRDFIYVEDVVHACLLASQSQLPSGEILNIGSGVQTSNEEVVTLIGQLCGQEIRVRIGAYAPHETGTAHWVADNQKAKSLLGWTPQSTLEDGLKKTIAWMQQHRSGYLTD
jgi:nucleoside-diphosphate-sugar epimerase